MQNQIFYIDLLNIQKDWLVVLDPVESEKKNTQKDLREKIPVISLDKIQMKMNCTVLKIKERMA